MAKIVHNFACKAKAMMPAAWGALALVPVCPVVHLSGTSVVTWIQWVLLST